MGDTGQADVAISMSATGDNGIDLDKLELEHAFRVFSVSPSEAGNQSDYHDVQVVIPPAVGMMAGAVGTDEANAKLDAMLAKIKEEKGMTVFGVPNYIDFGTGVVDSNDPVFGTLEIEQMLVGLLNQKLGGKYIEQLLRQDAAWDTAYQAYFDSINRQEAETASVADGSVFQRTMASGQEVLNLGQAGASATFEINGLAAETYAIAIHYSNHEDDDGVFDQIEVYVDEQKKGDFVTESTNDWNIFIESPLISLGSLSEGVHTIKVVAASVDAAGIDFDRFQLVFSEP